MINSDINIFRVTVILLLMFICAGSITARTIFVDKSAPEGDGSSWSNSLHSVSDALTAASYGDRIFIAEGVYYPDESKYTDPNLAGRSVSFELSDGVSVFGGMAGFSSPDPNYYDPLTYRTVLSGDLERNDGTGIDDNSYHVVTAYGLDENTVLSGCVISGGNCDGSGPAGSGYGGGMYNINSSIIVSRCYFIDNNGNSSCGIYSSGNSEPWFINCGFYNNRSVSDGAGMGVANGCNLSMESCVFSGNRSSINGGGIYCTSGSQVNIVNCTFYANNALGSGGSIYVTGNGDVYIANSIFWGNIDSRNDTSVYLGAGNLFADYTCMQGNVESIYGVALFSADPGFLNPDGPDGVAGTYDDDLRLDESSECINYGNNGYVNFDEDFIRRIRINDTKVDAGAYEYHWPPSLVAHWKLDEISGSLAADEISGNNGRLVGEKHWKPNRGRLLGALEFDGMGDFIDCGQSDKYIINEQITVSAWIKVKSFDKPWQAIVTKGDSSFRLQRYRDLRTLEFACSGLTVSGSTSSSINGKIPVDDNKWHHVAGIYDGRYISLYIDGKLDVQRSASGLINQNNYPLMIGENFENPGRFWKGSIDDVRIYNYAMSDVEISQLSTSGLTWHVDTVRGNDYNTGCSPDNAFQTIQAAIDKANNTDTVLVWPGVYNDIGDEIFYDGKAITVASAADAAILESSDGFAVTFNAGEKNDSILKNFVIRNSEHGIYITSGSSPMISNITFIDNQHAVQAYDTSDPLIKNCIFWNNMEDLYQCDAVFSWLRDDLDPMPLVWWDLNTNAGTTAYDFQGTSHGTIYNASWAEGKSGAGLYFDSSDDYILIPDNDDISLGMGSYTISLWINPETLVNEQTVLSKVTGQSNKEYMLGFEDGMLRFDMEYEGDDGRVYCPVSMEPFHWYHVAVTFDSSDYEVSIYVDSKRQYTNSYDSSPVSHLSLHTDEDLYIGKRGGSYDGYGYRGRIDEIMIYKRVLTPEEIEGIYLKGSGPMFADYEQGDYHLLSEKGRFLNMEDPNSIVSNGLGGIWVIDPVTSRSVDAGSWQDDPGWETDPSGARINQGAYGGTLYASRSDWPLKGDIDHSGKVDIQDFAIIADQWLREVPWLNDQ